VTGYSNYNGPIPTARKQAHEGKTPEQQSVENEAEWHRMHPLPVRMPRSYTFEVDFDPYAKRGCKLTFVNDETTLRASYNCGDENNVFDTAALVKDAFSRLVVNRQGYVIKQEMQSKEGVAFITSKLPPKLTSPMAAITYTGTSNSTSTGQGLETKTMITGTWRNLIVSAVEGVMSKMKQPANSKYNNQHTLPQDDQGLQPIDTKTRHHDGNDCDSASTKTHQMPWRRVVVASVSGPLARQGLRQGDVITHINGEEFDGNAEKLRDILDWTWRGGGEGQHADHTIQIVVNAERGTAEVLRLRSLA